MIYLSFAYLKGDGERLVTFGSISTFEGEPHVLSNAPPPTEDVSDDSEIVFRRVPDKGHDAIELPAPLNMLHDPVDRGLKTSLK